MRAGQLTFFQEQKEEKAERKETKIKPQEKNQSSMLQDLVSEFIGELVNRAFFTDPKKEMLNDCKNLVDHIQQNDSEATSKIDNIFYLVLKIVLQKTAKDPEFAKFNFLESLKCKPQKTDLGNFYRNDLINNGKYNLLKFRYFGKVVEKVRYRDMRYIGQYQKPDYKEDKYYVGIEYFSLKNEEKHFQSMRTKIKNYQLMQSTLCELKGSKTNSR